MIVAPGIGFVLLRGSKEMSSILADQLRPRTWAQMRGGGDAGPSFSHSQTLHCRMVSRSSCSPHVPTNPAINILGSPKNYWPNCCWLQWANWSFHSVLVKTLWPECYLTHCIHNLNIPYFLCYVIIGTLISSYIRKPFLIYDFATAPLWISL